jgi:CPA2 family monovalent cation:H+ antiporter-2
VENSPQLFEYLIQDLAVVLIAASLAGWLCRKLGLSVIVGYLGAGILVGTPQIAFPYVTDPARIQLLAQLGLVFLMFFIGLRLRLRKLKEIGFGVVLAVVVTALGTLTIARLGALVLGFDEATALFFAAMLMVSSSAIVGKLLQDNQLVHERSGQLALAITLLEDLVAIILLGYLGSYIAMAEAGSGSSGLGAVFSTIGLLVAFVVLLIIPGVIFLPRLLHRFERRGGIELETLLVAGLLFTFSWLTLRAGFSLALGAFVCGVILAETDRVPAVERAFSGLRDIFVAVFFTAIGMFIDITRLPEAIELIVLGVVLAFTARILSAIVGLLLACEEEDAAIKAAFCVTPIGEFSFVIAGLGVSAGLLDGRLQIAAVGIAFITSLTSPILVKNADRFVRFFRVSHLPGVKNALELYRSAWTDIGQRSDQSVIWKLLRPRVWQIGAELVLVTAVLLFALPVQAPLLEWISGHVGNLWQGMLTIYWLLVLIIVLAPIIALYRNVNAVAMLLAEYFNQLIRGNRARRSILEPAIRIGGCLMLTLWLFNLLPLAGLSWIQWAIVLVLFLGGASLGWRHLVRWHSEAEFSLKAALAEELPSPAASSRVAFKQASEALGLRLVDCVLPERASVGGKSLLELGLRQRFGISLIALERQGFTISELSAANRIFPGDHLFLVGESAALNAGLTELMRIEVPESTTANHTELSDAILETLAIEITSRLIGSSLRELEWSRHFGVQVVGIVTAGEQHRKEVDAETKIAAGDQVVITGSCNAVRRLKASLE